MYWYGLWPEHSQNIGISQKSRKGQVLVERPCIKGKSLQSFNQLSLPLLKALKLNNAIIKSSKSKDAKNKKFSKI